MIDDNKLIFNMKNVFYKLPITADIFLTNFCNNHCNYCTYGRWDKLSRKPRYMTYDKFIEYVQILLQFNVKSIILTGGGEPTLNPDFEKITTYLEKNHIPYGVNTNFNILKKIAPKYLKVSLDASNPKQYKVIRGVDRYTQVIKNIQAYRIWQKENNVPTKLEIQCVVKDYADLDFYYAHKDLDVDYIIFRPLESTQAQYYKNKNNVAPILDKLERIQCRDKRVVINYKFNRIGYTPRECIANFAQIALDEQGNVMYCCHKPYEIIGHITEKDILKKKLQYKTNMSKCDVPCRLTGCNYLLDKAKEHTSDSMFI